MGYVMKCKPCQQDCYWVECPTGGWWAHTVHPVDNHDADTGFFPHEVMDHNGNWVTR